MGRDGEELTAENAEKRRGGAWQGREPGVVGKWPESGWGVNPECTFCVLCVYRLCPESRGASEDWNDNGPIWNELRNEREEGCDWEDTRGGCMVGGREGGVGRDAEPQASPAGEVEGGCPLRSEWSRGPRAAGQNPNARFRVPVPSY